ncbi:MAG: GNAT family N-acetyltransferase, partial [Blastochloris sp.]|nr:GNAT family N-acetyltransferase [Blastochloris sp.]
MRQKRLLHTERTLHAAGQSNAVVMAAWDLIDRARGYTYAVVTSGPDYDAALHLRWVVYADTGYINPADYPDQRLSDPYEAHSTTIIAKHRDRVIGTGRLIAAWQRNQIQDNHNVILPTNVDLRSTAETSRIAVDRAYRSGDRTAFLGLIRYGYL